jgi:hypothetical protein
MGEFEMKRIAIGTMIVMATASAALSQASAQVVKNISFSKRETIAHLPGGVRIHIFIRNDGRYGLVIDRKGAVEHYAIDPRTGTVTKL